MNTSIWKLPQSLTIGDRGFSIRTNYLDILKIITHFQDPELDDESKWEIALRIFYKDFKELKPEDIPEASLQLTRFIDAGMNGDGDNTPKPQTIDWDHDAPIIIPAVNAVAGHDIRMDEYIHWWTFLSYFMNVSAECVLSSVIRIRDKKAKGKKLDDTELEFIRNNRSMVELPEYMDEEEAAELDDFYSMF